jgi:hypothetical protein
MMATQRRVAALTALVLAVLLGAACQPADRLKIGMTQAEVEQIMGRPTAVVEDARRFREELPNESACADGAARVLIYQTKPQRHVRLGLDGKGVVKCIVHTRDLMH